MWYCEKCGVFVNGPLCSKCGSIHPEFVIITDAENIGKDVKVLVHKSLLGYGYIEGIIKDRIKLEMRIRR